MFRAAYFDVLTRRSVAEDFRFSLPAVEHEADDEACPDEGKRRFSLDAVVTRFALLRCHDLIALIEEP